MILELILTPIFFLIDKIIDIIPKFPAFNYSFQGLTQFFQIANTLLPSGYLKVFLTSVILFKNFSLIWAIVEWCYKKIPGVN